MASKTHEFVSRRALLPLARTARAARGATRPQLLAFREGLRFRRDALGWTDGQRRAWVLKRLREVVRRAARETDYYRELFRERGFDAESDFGFDDFARLPVLEREDVRASGARLVSASVSKTQLRKDSTGGSTGEPTEVWLGPEERGWRESGLEFPMQKIGVPEGSAVGFLWGHNLDPRGDDSLRQRFHDFESNVRRFDCFRLSPEVFDRYDRELERWRPACVVAYASALGHLAEHLGERERRPSYPTRCFVTGAEKLLPAHREAIERVFRRPVHERYGSRDVGLMAFQYEPWAGEDFGVDWACVLVEPETEEETSSVLVTKLRADGTQMLRYRVGDAARFPAGARPGHPALVLREIVGRDTARIWLPDGRWIHGIQLPHMLKDYPVAEFMFRQRADYSVELEVVARRGFGEESRRAIHETVAANLPGLPVSVKVVERIERTRANKWRPVVSEVEARASGVVKGEAARVESNESAEVTTR